MNDPHSRAAEPSTVEAVDPAPLAEKLAGADLFTLFRIVLPAYGSALRIACSFGVEDMILLHEAARAGEDVGIAPRVFLLDTGRLHQETYDLVDRVRERYRLPIEVFAPDTIRVEELVRRDGPNGFYRSIQQRKECCAVRKLGPLDRALFGARIWVTGLRREQSSTRNGVDLVEVDALDAARLKLNPLVNWTQREVWEYARERSIPTHALHAKGFPSIGCAPCTRAVAPGEDVRAGRWWWESPEHKECGLHARRPS